MMLFRLIVLMTFLTLAPAMSNSQDRAVSNLKIGDTAPGFTLKDIQGQAKTLNAILKKKPHTAIVFLRSAVWCRYCRQQLIELNENQKRLGDSGIQIVTISYDIPKQLKKAAGESQLSLTMLSDPQSRVIDAYGVRDPRVKDLSQYDGHAYPVTFLVNQSGMIQSIFADSTKERHRIDDLIKAAQSPKSTQN